MRKSHFKLINEIRAPLRAERINEAYQFQITFLDYLVPLYNKNHKETSKPTYCSLYVL